MIKTDLSSDVRKTVAKNPDIGVTDSGNIALKNVKTNKVIETDVPLKNYAKEQLIMYRYSLSLSGENFYPKKLEPLIELNIEDCFEPGDKKIKIQGTFKYGYIRLGDKNLLTLLDKSLSIYENYKKDIDEVIVDVIYFYKGQCNLEFSTEEIRAISSFDACLTISCDSDECN